MINPKITLVGRAMAIFAIIILGVAEYIVGAICGKKGLIIFLSVLSGIIILFFVYWLIRFMNNWKQIRNE